MYKYLVTFSQKNRSVRKERLSYYVTGGRGGRGGHAITQTAVAEAVEAVAAAAEETFMTAINVKPFCTARAS